MSSATFGGDISSHPNRKIIMFNNIVFSFVFHCRSIARLLRSVLLLVVLLPALLCISLAPSYAASASESKLPPGGRVVVTGSVPLANLISLWADDFTYRNPRVSITVADAGTAVGVEALFNGTADSVITDMPLSRQEEERFMDPSAMRQRSFLWPWTG